LIIVRKVDFEWKKSSSLQSCHTKISLKVMILVVDKNRTIHEREMAQKDQRNLYLLQEGFINEENRGSMNDRGM